MIFQKPVDMISIKRHILVLFTVLWSAALSCGCGKTVSSGDGGVVPEEQTDDVVPDEQTGEEDAAAAMAERLGLGWNLGNQMDSHNNGVAEETAWGNAKATQATFDGLKAKGFSSVRIPVTWMGHIGGAPDYEVETAWMDRVAELVGYAETAGLNVIINVHHDGADSSWWLNVKKAASSSSDYVNITRKFKALWRQIALRFADRGDFLIFEPFNELHDGGWGWGDNLRDGGAQYAVVNKWVQAFVDVVRETGGCNAARWLGIPGYCANPDLTMAHLTLPKDSAEGRLMVAVHCYDPYEYTLECKYDEWGHTAVNNPCPAAEAELLGVMERLKAKYVDNGIPVYFGESGCSNRSVQRQKEFQRYYLEYFCKACRDCGIAPFFWDNGYDAFGRETSAVINHSTGEYIADGKMMTEAMVRAVSDDSESYTLASVYDSAP